MNLTDVDTYPTFKELRESRGYTQRDLAEQIGVTTTAISQVENGGNLPSLKTFAGMADTFDVDMEDLYHLLIEQST